MSEETPEGLKVINKLIRKARVQKLTVDDGEYMERKIKDCCDTHLRCGHIKECDRRHNMLCGLLPPPAKVELYSHKKEPGAWLQATLH